MLTFGSLLQKWRKRSGLKQAELAKAGNIALITLSSYESGKRYPPQETVERLASLLGLSKAERELLIHLARKRQPAGTPLPNPLTPCIGREQLLDQVQTLLQRPSTRLITLSGTAGVGKTRLAIEIASQVQQQFTDGVVFIDLASIHRQNELPAAILRMLKPSFVLAPTSLNAETPHVLTATDPAKDPHDSALNLLVSMLRDTRMLLVLDTVEHIADIEQALRYLLQQCPRLKILLTSRRSLHVEGERLVHVTGLSYPVSMPMSAAGCEQVAEYAAVRLFVSLVQSRDSRFQLDDANCAPIARICAAFDGIPLALELAAACFPALTPRALADRLHAWPSLLVQGAPERPDRHWSLLNALQWSYDLLHPSGQWLLRRLAIFPGEFSLTMVELLTPDAEHRQPAEDLPPFDHVAQLRLLLEHNLLHYRGDVAGVPHYHMLTVIRDFAARQLDSSGERAQAHRQLIRIALNLIANAQGDAQAGTADQRDGGLKYDIELVETACTAALHEQTLGDAARLSLTVSDWYAQLGDWSAARRCLTPILARRSELDYSDQLPILQQAGLLARRQGDYAQAREFFQAFLQLSQGAANERQVAYALNILGLIESAQGAYERAEALYQDSLRRWRHLHSLRNEAAVLTNLATLASYRQEHDRAKSLHQQALHVYQAMNDQRGVGRALSNQGLVVLRQGAYSTAQSFFREGLALATHSSDLGFRALARCNLGFCALFQEDIHVAEEHLRQSLREYQQLGDQRGIAYSLDGLAGVAALRGQGQQAALLFGAAERLRTQIDAPLPDVDHVMYQPLYDAAHAQCGATAYELARIRGTVQPLALVMNECGL